MKAIFNRVESDLSAYTAATKKFESNSSEKAQNNKSALDSCISSIEEYLSTSL